MLKKVMDALGQNSSQKAIALESAFGVNNYHPLPVVLHRGEGIYLWDTDGRQYIDMMSAYSAVSLGHSHPRIIQKLVEQAQTLVMTSRAFYTDTLGLFLQKICQISKLDMALPMNTGAEAVETAIKAARQWGYKVKKIPDNKAEIIVVDGNFHGRTTTIISFSTEPNYQKNFGPFTPGFKIVAFGNIDAIGDAITENTCAVLVEPIQGEAGIRMPPAGYLSALRALCDQHDVLLLLDEIQSGLGRTGRMFCFEHDNARPDVLILGKALGGGVLPVSAVVGTAQVMGLFQPGSHGSTFGGNPLAAAVGLEALHVIEEEKLTENSATLGDYLLKELQKSNSPLIREVRGKGLWIGIDFDPKQIAARKVCEKLLEHGILSKDTHGTVVRLAPPLVITRAEIDTSLSKIAQTLNELTP